MRNTTHAEIERIVADADWDSFTLLFLISRWAEENRQSESLIGHLAGLAADEDDLDLDEAGDD